MNNVKKYAPNYTETGHYLNMAENAAGEYVLHSDYAALAEVYAAVVAERDELARAIGKDPFNVEGPAALRWRCRGCGQFYCDVLESDGHAPGCPVALAENIAKEVGDGR